ncbi:uncharacterized protein N7515_000663 [Penicillium bovifimosum]|uniref:Putative zinc-finger domain-containing protein n=1 Tax=Penicillium bovifimosum TaxID=126998 RepID=A0A9W9HFG0_9EURO|nr:uncharacterized protein N7515_000663 [Penicillium bovifimosum]KAJ5146099.1 hypothetical protein N7515_000663 [Penicillium bovifimosum]
MSDHPPPYGGHANYAQQWPPAYPSMIPPNFPASSEYTQMYQTPSTNLGQPLNYNMASVNANSRISGSSGPSNSAPFFPPQFPGYNEFDPLRFPPQFPAMPFAPMGYPPAPMPAGFLNGAQEHSTVGVGAHTTSVPAENNREEGEVSEEADEPSILPTRKAGRQHSDLEEGETVSSSAPSASSGSPYNPPLSVSADPNIIAQAAKPQKHEPSKTAPDSQPPKSVAQLRIQAQGALLSLAPHKIRYNELIAEGINPVVLRRLYEEVGIKVTPPSDQGPSVLEDPPARASVTGKPLDVNKPVVAEIANDEKEVIRKSELPVSQPSAPSSAASPKPDKPLERKELIARMLAAKAAKTSKDASPTASAKSSRTAPTNEPRPTQKVPAIKEKSKAQTELARQRIEELKRQSLLKAQQSAQGTLAPLQLESPAPAIQHPLPLRPPVPGSQPVATLPGLVMTGSEQDGKDSSASEPGPAIALGPASTSQANQRKRPRASDFDEPAAPPRHNFNPTANRFNPADKLIIAISDDESLYGDDEGDNMDLDSSSEQDAAPIVTSTIAKPPAQIQSTQSPVPRLSTSTPNAPSSLSDQADIRIKDMEIQAMRRKIAELELRRKSKLAASRTQSPRTVDDSGSSSSGGPSSAAATTSEEDSMNTKHITAPTPVAPALQPQTPSETLISPVPCEEATDQAANGAIDDTAQASASIVSDSAGSAMDESDDSSSDSSHSSNEGENEPAGSPAHVGIDPAILPASSAAMAIDTPEQSPSQGLSSAFGDRDPASVEEFVTAHSPSIQSQREMSAESDGYEPPEPESDAAARSEDSSYSPPPFSPALPGLVESAAVSTQSCQETQADQELTNAPQVLEPLPQSALQVGAPGTKATSAISVPRFTPYISPLRAFKAYRYHSDYEDEVPGGYRSLTYSHNIDPMEYLCPYDLNGGVCNDKTCEFQHFRDITLSEPLTSTDDKILVQMGSVREGRTEEEKETYLTGLKEIINNLRRDKVKDFNAVASEIAAYRRRFLHDPTRVLSL